MSRASRSRPRASTVLPARARASASATRTSRQLVVGDGRRPPRRAQPGGGAGGRRPRRRPGRRARRAAAASAHRTARSGPSRGDGGDEVPGQFGRRDAAPRAPVPRGPSRSPGAAPPGGGSRRSRIVSRSRSWREAEPVAGGRQHPGLDGVAGGDLDGDGEVSRARRRHRAAGRCRRPRPPRAVPGSGRGAWRSAVRRRRGRRRGSWSTCPSAWSASRASFAHEERVAAGAPVNGVGGRPVDGPSVTSLDELVGGIGVDALDVDVLGVADERSRDGPGRGVRARCGGRRR